MTAAVLCLLGAAHPASAADGDAVRAAQAMEMKGASGTTDPGRGTVNDWDCQAAPDRKPVVLVHGTFGFTKAPASVRSEAWHTMAASLKAEGRCVYALQYGTTRFLGVGEQVPGTGDMYASARELKVFVDGVKAASTASKVDLVGWSQGGLVARQYLKDTGGASVDHLVGLAPPNHGSHRIDALLGGLIGYTATSQMYPGSEFLRTLNGSGELVGGVAYTMLATHGDDWVNPADSAFLSGAPEQVTNRWLPDSRGEGKGPEHAMLHVDPDTIAWVKEGIRYPGKPASPHFTPR
ncbi:esterase/lipase family protein [Streptomyces lavendulae]|uniref:esterase/lipase family protein n=1 Tax=Streptomyces lavendulae TaxID=1914 RepID=UPI0037218FCA